MDRIREAAELLLNAENCAVLTGAGISVESGIPAFRGYQGLWEKFDPMEYAHIGAFLAAPEKVWRMLGELMDTLASAEPNYAHFALAELEEKGKVGAIITQNVDGLHQRAGSKNVIEFHGNADYLVCVACGEKYNSAEKVSEGMPPRCICGKILKPDVVFFGEPIPEKAIKDALRATVTCDLFMLVGTSATVAPANQLPEMALNRGVRVIEINPEPTHLSSREGVIWVAGGASEVLRGITGMMEDIS